jgi:hypothetical protein
MFFQTKNILKNNRYHTPKQYLTLYLAQIFNNNFFFLLIFSNNLVMALPREKNNQVNFLFIFFSHLGLTRLWLMANMLWNCGDERIWYSLLVTFHEFCLIRDKPFYIQFHNNLYFILWVYILNNNLRYQPCMQK